MESGLTTHQLSEELDQQRGSRHWCRRNGSAALNLLRLPGFDSTREGLQAVMDDIKELLTMARRQTQERPA